MEKCQSEQQQKQARHSITLFYRMTHIPIVSTKALQPADTPAISVGYQSAPVGLVPFETTATGAKPLTAANQDKLAAPAEINQTKQVGAKTGSSWVFVYDALNSEIKIRHYSPKTLKSYRSWTRHFQAFTKSKDFEALNQQDVVDFF